MKINAEGIEGVANLLLLAGLGYLGYLAYKHFSDFTDKTADDIAGIFVPDANAAVQQTFTDFKSALDANGNPPVGSDLYNQLAAIYQPSAIIHNGNGG